MVRQTTYRKDVKGVEIFVNDYVSHSDSNGYTKKDGTSQKVFVLKKVNIYIEKEKVSFNLGDYANMWKGEHCEVFSMSKIEEYNIPIGRPFYFKEDKVFIVSDEDYFRGRYRARDCSSDWRKVKKDIENLYLLYKNAKTQLERDEILSNA